MSDKATPFVYRTTTTTIENGEAPLTSEGTRFCPGVQGGTEWNGPAFLRTTNMIYVNSVDWCTTVWRGPVTKLKNKLGLPWTGSSRLMLPFGKNDDPAKGTGWLNAIDADDGTMRWRYHAPTPLVAGVLATAGGLVFTADLRGNVIGFDAATGDQRFHYNTGQPIGGGVISYDVGGKQYVAVASGLNAPLTWVVKSSKAKVVIFSL
jgi:alcohol dehydrogenase (cytochrome c)